MPTQVECLVPVPSTSLSSPPPLHLFVPMFFFLAVFYPAPPRMLLMLVMHMGRDLVLVSSRSVLGRLSKLDRFHVADTDSIFHHSLSLILQLYLLALRFQVIHATFNQEDGFS
jgi:hypothetical protein